MNTRILLCCFIIIVFIAVIATCKKRDYYQVLEVTKDATPAQITKRFRQLARKYHPDNKDTGDEKKYVELTEAYDVLNDPDKKAHYDRFGHSDDSVRMQPQGGGFPFGGSAGGFPFGGFPFGGFGGGAGRGSAGRGGGGGKFCSTTTRCVNGVCTTEEKCY